MSGIYIHVPFCQSRCIYCDFYSTTCDHVWQGRYVSAAIREMQRRRHELDPSDLRTIYLGGGTPSQLRPALLLQLFEALSRLFPFDRLTEVTIEANPDDVTPQWLDAVRQTPVNRISMGVQTFDDAMLRFLRRRHTAEQAVQAVALCRRYGYENLSLDLIYGLPGQTLPMWQADVRRVLHLGVPHLSAYALSYEEGTPLHRLLEEGAIGETSDDLQLRMYEHLLDATAEAGMEHYEISSFARPGWRSRHNSAYWDGTPYLGIGPGAHSYDGARTRRANDTSLRSYCEAAEPPHSIERLSDEERYDERVMTRLRTADGLPLCLLTDRQRAYCLTQASPHLQAGRLILRDGVLRLHRSGLFVMGDIISDLMWDDAV